MSKTTADYLRDILHELDDIIEFTRAGREAFEGDVKTRKAVEDVPQLRAAVESLLRSL